MAAQGGGVGEPGNTKVAAMNELVDLDELEGWARAGSALSPTDTMVLLDRLRDLTARFDVIRNDVEKFQFHGVVDVSVVLRSLPR